ncbi:unnamed protein product [Pedinophyceae sp. YPF-701]|nr:unnamed protein product [Pedinophyceae sp. YPF-701]
MPGSDKPRYGRSPLSLHLPDRDAREWLKSERRADDVARNVKKYPRAYKGKRWYELTLEDLTAAPRPWPEVVGWEGGADAIAARYSVPLNLPVLVDRVEENLVRWAPNYVRAAGLAGISVLAGHPKAALGLLMLVVLWRLMARLSAASERAASSGAISPLQAMWHTLLYVACGLSMWLVALHSRGPATLAMLASSCALLVFSHAGLRRCRCEEQHASRVRSGLGVGIVWSWIVGSVPSGAVAAAAAAAASGSQPGAGRKAN